MPKLITLPTPFPLSTVNAVLIEAQPLTLIDCGPKHPDTLAALEAALAAHGHRIEDLRQLILTHHHVDHVGLAGTIVARSRAAVLSHPYNAPYLGDYEAQRRRNLPFFAQIWAEGGVPEPILEKMLHSSEGMGRWLDPVAITRPLDEGDTLTFTNPPQQWHVYYTPGHAGGLICLYNTQTAELLANDHLIRDITSNPVLEPPPLGSVGGPRPKRLVEYLRHMQRMAALTPAPRIAYTGHGEPVLDVAELVRKRAAFPQRRAEKIYAALSAGPRTLWQLTEPLFARLTRGIDFFLAISETLAHLDLLESEGRVESLCRDGLVTWAQLRPTRS